MHILAQYIGAGDDRVGEARLIQVLHLFQPGQGREGTGAAHGLVDLLGGMGQEGGQHGVGIADDLGGGMQHRSQTVGVVLDLPGLLGRNVLVDVTHQAHGLTQSRLLAVAFNQPADRIEGLQTLFKEGPVLLRQPGILNLGDAAEVLVEQVGDTVDQVPPGSRQLLIVVAHEFRPGEV